MKQIPISIILLLLLCGLATAALPASYDCRDLGYVTPVKDQGNCACCNAFTTVAMLESAILANGGANYDLSEEHAKNCPFEAVTRSGGGCSGGNANMIINIFTQRGSLREWDNPYKQTQGVCNYIADPVIRVTDWHILSLSNVPSTTMLKQNILKYGPIFTTINERCLPRNYNGRSVIRAQSDRWSGHSVLIVGWDDSRSCWIIKNSWGTKWGDNGYGYVRFGAGRIGAFSSVITGYEVVDPNVRTLHHDEAGYTRALHIDEGRPTSNAWQMAIFNIGSERVEAVEFWTTARTDDVDIIISDGVSGLNRYRSNYGNTLYERNNLRFATAGYHSVDVGGYVRSTTGKIVVRVRFENAKNVVNSQLPLAIDTKGIASKQTYVCTHLTMGFWHPAKLYYIDPRTKLSGDATLRLRVRSGGSSVSKAILRAEGSTTIQMGETTEFSTRCPGTYCGPVEWRCSDQKIGTISPDGLFTAKMNGKVAISAICSGRKSNTITVTVANAPEPEPTPAPTPEPTPTPEIVTKAVAIKAVDDYLDGRITKKEAIKVIMKYFEEGK